MPLVFALLLAFVMDDVPQAPTKPLQNPRDLEVTISIPSSGSSEQLQ